MRNTGRSWRRKNWRNHWVIDGTKTWQKMWFYSLGMEWAPTPSQRVEFIVITRRVIWPGKNFLTLDCSRWVKLKIKISRGNEQKKIINVARSTKPWDKKCTCNSTAVVYLRLQTYNTNKQVPDSASTATALFSGVKTNYKVVGVDANVQLNDCEASLVKDHQVQSIIGWAQAVGKDTGRLIQRCSVKSLDLPTAG